MSYSKAALKGCGGYNDAALEGYGGYNDAALEGYGGYNDAALEGFGGYNDAALEGFGGYNDAALKGYGKLKKGSKEAKARMAYLRSLRGKGCSGKRSRRTKRTKEIDGGSLLGLLAPKYFNYISGWAKDGFDERAAQKNEIARLKEKIKNKKGGKFDPKKDITDFIMGPWGWLKMGLRKKREREIARLRQEAGEA